MSKAKLTLPLFAVVVLAAVMALPATAGAASVGALAKQVKALQKQVNLLKGQVSASSGTPGPAGAAGAGGATGATGTKGDSGDKGFQGIQGVKGDPGVGNVTAALEADLGGPNADDKALLLYDGGLIPWKAVPVKFDLPVTNAGTTKATATCPNGGGITTLASGGGAQVTSGSGSLTGSFPSDAGGNPAAGSGSSWTATVTTGSPVKVWASCVTLKTLPF